MYLVLLLINYLDIEVNINLCGHQVKLNWRGYPKQFKQCGELLTFILCCYMVKVNYLGRKVKIKMFGYQVKFTHGGNLKQ